MANNPTPKSQADREATATTGDPSITEQAAGPASRRSKGEQQQPTDASKHYLSAGGSCLVLVVCLFLTNELAPDRGNAGGLQWSLLAIAAGGAVAITAITVLTVPWWTARELAAELPTAWSFKDSPLASATVGATTLIALFGASNVLTAVFPTEAVAKASLALIAVASALGTGAVSLAPFLLRASGRTASEVTQFGLYTAVGSVVFGACLLILTIVLQLKWLDTPGWFSGLEVVTAVATAAGLLTVWVISLSTTDTLEELMPQESYSARKSTARPVL